MKILLAASAFDMGGAETHLIELCRTLSFCGHSVIVVSPYGRLVERLKSYGGTHYELPLGSSSLFSLAVSAWRLYKILKKDKPDVIHAHSRIAAFVCTVLAKYMKIPLVCTAHARFSLSPVKRLLSSWGDVTIAVSEDIRQYLCDFYSLDGENVFVVPNGIDTHNFSPKPNRERAKKLIFVSRMDNDCSHGAFLLCKIAPRLKEIFPDISISLVGGGSDFSKVRQKANEVNGVLGFECIRTLGTVFEIAELLRESDLFIGVSRAAIEAASCGLSVILCGNEGYMGVLDEENFSLAAATNFCCRGFARASESELFEDICRVLSSDDERLQKALNFNRNYILEMYSSEVMCKKTLQVYDFALKKSHLSTRKKNAEKVLISGYYGENNVGDDAIFSVLIDGLRRVGRELDIVALTRNSRKTQQRFGVRCISKYNLFALEKQLKGASLLISGGGNLLQNKTSRRSLGYYMFIIRRALAHNVRVAVYANGFGPISGAGALGEVFSLLAKVNYISVRDVFSYRLLLENCERSPKSIKLTADPAFLLESAERSRVQYLCTRIGILKDEKYVAFCLKTPKLSSSGEDVRDIFEKSIAAAIEKFCLEYKMTPLLFAFHGSEDIKLCKNLCEKLNCAAERKARFISNVFAPDIIGLFGKMSMVVGMRLHSLIFAAATGVPFAAIFDDVKVEAFMEYAQNKALLAAENASCETLFSLFESGLKADFDTSFMKKAAENEIFGLADFFDKPE